MIFTTTTTHADVLPGLSLELTTTCVDGGVPPLNKAQLEELLRQLVSHARFLAEARG